MEQKDGVVIKRALQQGIKSTGSSDIANQTRSGQKAGGLCIYKYIYIYIFIAQTIVWAFVGSDDDQLLLPIYCHMLTVLLAGGDGGQFELS